MTLRSAVLGAALSLVASVSAAQPSSDPPPYIVTDVRGTFIGLPTGVAWTPPVPAEGGEVPSRTIGYEIGGHFRFVHFGNMSLAVGATLLMGEGRFAPPAPVDGATVVLPEVTTRFTAFSPQLSLNFGRRLGWSYLSAGLGRAKVRSEASEPAEPGSPTLMSSAWSPTLNFGGGARWFITDHLGVNFDLRWHRLSADATRTGVPRERLLMLGVGVSLQ